jgi:hypothetical protein
LKDTNIIFNHPGFKKIEENIWVINNFLTKEETAEYVKTAIEAEESEWNQQGSGWYEGKVLALHNKEVINTSHKIVEKFSNLFEGKANYHFGSPVSIHRMKPEEDMFVHADYAELDEFKEECILFNVALYHNEFEGGELFYPGKDFIEYKPEPGDLVIHPGTSEYRHGVRKVTGENTRYMSNLWVADNVGYSIRVSGNG